MLVRANQQLSIAGHDGRIRCFVQRIGSHKFEFWAGAEYETISTLSDGIAQSICDHYRGPIRALVPLAGHAFLPDQFAGLQFKTFGDWLLAVQQTTTVGPLDRVTLWLEPFRLNAQFEDSNPDFEFRLESMIGPYQLLERIGEGGMGTVYRARQTTPVIRDVALKLIKPGMDTREVLMRFESELQTLAMMQHPNIASVFDAGMTSQGRPYFVMELVRGLAIDKYCDEPQVSFFKRLQLFVSVCRAIQHAHDKQIIHRDLKPSNVLILTQDGEPVVKVSTLALPRHCLPAKVRKHASPSLLDWLVRRSK